MAKSLPYSQRGEPFPGSQRRLICLEIHAPKDLMSLVSVIVRTKDRPGLLREALESLSAQTHRPLEVVVVNDGGEDVSGLVSEFSECFERLKYLAHERPRGRAAAANTGLKAAEGEFFGFLDDDDLLLPQAISILLEAFEPEHVLVYGLSRLVRPGKQSYELLSLYGRPFSRALFRVQNYIPTGSFLVRKEAAQGLAFDETLPCLEDWDFLLRLEEKGPFGFVNRIVHVYRLQEGSFATGKKTSYPKEEVWKRIYRRYWSSFSPELLFEAQELLTREILELRHQRDLWQGHYHDLWRKYARLGEEKARLEDLQVQLKEELEEELARQRKKAASLAEEVAHLRRTLALREAELAAVYDSLGWQLLTRYRKLKERLFPPESRRGRLYALALKGAKVLLAGGPRALYQKGKNYLLKQLKARPTRKALPASETPLPSPEEIVLPRAAKPRASIIIPVYNQWPVTLACLASLARHTPPDCEVILVDDASTDETPRQAPRVRNLVYLRSSQNRGFVHSVNAGARRARGEFLIFLNNDTLLTPGWCEALLRPLADPEVGLVGAKLLYSDGRLQEAGGIIFRDASGWNYGHRDDPGKPAYNFLREVDYCSGACIAVRRKDFEALGGFDETFAPAYYEDTDLAFRLRARGQKVVYQPEAVVYHLEGASCGRDLSKGLKRYQVLNQKKFLRRWEDTLRKEHYPPEPGLLFLARKRLKEGIILVADHHVPLWDQDSGSLRMFNLLTIFQELGYHVIFWPDNLAALEPYTRRLQALGIEVIYGQVDFRRYLSENAPFIDLLWACRVRFAPQYLLPAKEAGLATVFDTVDLHFVREEREARLKEDPALMTRAQETKRLELTLCRAADCTLVVSRDEVPFLEKEGISGVRVVPNIHEQAPPGPGFEARRDLMFIGSFQHPPNEDAVCWFVAEIWPLIKKALPEVKFYVVGSSPTRRVKALAGEDIIVTGYVPEVQPYFHRCRVFVAPLRYGAGLKGKVGQAMSFGLPCVLTPIAAEGLGGRHGEEYLLAKGPEDFAREVVRLYQDRELWEKLARKGREHIRRHFSRQAVKETVSSLLKELVPEPKFRRFL